MNDLFLLRHQADIFYLASICTILCGVLDCASPCPMSSVKSTSAIFPDLPSRSGHAPWPADITDGHITLKETYEAASRALNLDESDPIRLQHYNKQIRTIVLPTLQALAACEHPSVPECYIEDAASSIQRLAQLMATALKSSLER